MPELAFAIIICALPGLGVLGVRAADAITRHRDRRGAHAEREAARLTATAAATARASAHAAHVAELAAFDADARRILDALDVPCVCSQVLTHEWDERTQSYRQRWTVPVHFTACVKHWPATTGAPPPPGTIAHLQRQGGPMLTPAARVNAERARYVAEAWARRVTDAANTAELDATIARLAEIQAATGRARGSTPTTYGVPGDCTCVPDHARGALANTHVVHRVGCATSRGPHAAEWRPMGDNG